MVNQLTKMTSLNVPALLAKIQSKEARVAIVGLGYVGLPLALAFGEAQLRVCGIDLDQDKINQIKAGKSYIEDVSSQRISTLVQTGYLEAHSSFEVIEDVDAIIVCVPTPLSKTKDPDMSYIISAAEEIACYVNEGQLIILESTTYPGTTEEIILPRITRNGYKVGQDFLLAFSPERTDPGRTDYTVRTTPKVVGGVTPQCLEVASALYRQIIDQIVPVSSTAAAEMVKLLENTFRAVNIGLVNEIAIICDRLGLNVWEIVNAAATKPYGFMPFYPGPGLGGHCIPVDPHYLAWKLKTLDYSARFIELASEINYAMPEFVVNKVTDVLNKDKKPVNGSSILVLGVAYKRDVGDIRESPALDVISLLASKGALVSYHDPYVPSLEINDTGFECVDPDDHISSADCVVIITDHSTIDWATVHQQAARIVDTRNVFGRLKIEDEKIVRL